MKHTVFFLLVLIFAMGLGVSASAQDTLTTKKIIHGPYFVDENGDGFNDFAPDHDGDGIPNGQDPDYNGPGKAVRRAQFIDTNGDGIADNVVPGCGFRFRWRFRRGWFGPGASIPPCYGIGPRGRGPWWLNR